jgi:hypothetical protein
MRACTWLGAATLLALGAAPAWSQDVTVHGQVRPRFEYRDPVAPIGGGKDDFTVMRVRAALEVRPNPGLSVFIQMQDVRYWGEETDPSSDYTADHLDLHQGYVRYNNERISWLTATVGRQETALGEERLVGRSDWSAQGRAFDGVRLDAIHGGATATVLGYKIADATSPTVTADVELFGVYVTAKGVGPGALDVFWLHNRGSGSVDTRQHTLGLRYAVDGAVDGRFEGAIQRGRRTGDPVSAYLLAVRVGRAFAGDKGHLTVWYDYLSGDDTPNDGKVQVFSTLYGTNHKNYGFADQFTSIPANTAGHGLQDRAVKLSLRPASDLAVEADVHSFAAARRGTLSTPHYADEVDLTVTQRCSPNLSAMAGMARVLQDRGMAEIGRLDRNMTWAFLMVDVVF